MTDNLTPQDRKRAMQAVKSRGTGPERRLRAMLAGMGLRGWRINYSSAPGNPDIAFPERSIAIFVDGCFWHACPICNRPLPHNNRVYWERKIRRNAERDQRCDAELEALGWRVLRIWEHELKRKADLALAASKIRAMLAACQKDEL
jgi:DNA mismatch endonuclease, patch repair protein